jgi:outer membrane protein assembly factor BamB
MRRRARLSVVAASAAIAAAIWAARGLRLRAAREHGAKAPSAATHAGSASARAAPRPLGTGRVEPGPPRMLHVDPRHTDRSPFVGPAHAPAVAWSFDTGGPVQAGAVVAPDGRIVVASLSGKLFLLDPTDGHATLAVDLGDRAYATPLAREDGLFVGSDADRWVVLQPGGAVRVKLETAGDVDVATTPAPWGGLVFAAGRVVYAARPDGAVLWRFRVRRKVFTSPAIGDDGTAYVGAQDGRVYALDPAGKARWETDLGADVDGGAAIGDDGTVHVGTDAGEVVALAPDSGAVRWRTQVGGFVRGALSIARDGAVLAGTYGPTPRVVSLAPDDGRVLWSFAVAGTGAAEQGIHGAPVEDAQGRLYFGAQDDLVRALDRDGALVWSLDLHDDVDAPLALLPDGTLLAGCDDGKLYALREP